MASPYGTGMSAYQAASDEWDQVRQAENQARIRAAESSNNQMAESTRLQQAPRTIAQQRQYESLSHSDRKAADRGALILDGNMGANGAGGSLNANYTQEQFDPWSKYRGAAGDMLAGGMDSANDPSNVYRDRLEQMVSGNGADFATSDPSYQFRFQQGQVASERSLAAKGLLNSGNAAAALQDYGQGMASQEYGAQFNRLLQGMQGVSQQYDTQQQRLMQMAGINLDPTGAAKMNLGIEGVNTDRINAANSYNLGVTQNANNRYATDVGAESARYAANMKGQPGNIDTQSLFAGKANSAVESANWWADQRQGTQFMGATNQDQGRELKLQAYR